MPPLFTIEKVTNEAQLRKVYRLRYKVYCEEWGFERKENHPDGLEIDIYDKNAVHYLVLDTEKKAVGTIRLIFDSEDGFPVERYCGVDIDSTGIDRKRCAEISRLAISKSYRRRAEDRYIYGPDEERRIIGSFEYDDLIYRRRFTDRFRNGYIYNKTSRNSDRRKRHEVLMSLCKAVYLESKDRGLTHWYAIMTKGLHSLLGRYGIHFEPSGEPVDYHGIRTPYRAEIKAIEESVSRCDPELYEEFTRELMEKKS
jgi:N-acyl-L-homoserine lactone synthetase